MSIQSQLGAQVPGAEGHAILTGDDGDPFDGDGDGGGGNNKGMVASV